jgi:hypothetical protein
MRWMKWLGVAAALMLVIACFMEWVYIVSKKITVTGFESTGTHFGKPGAIHLILSILFILFSLIPRLWAKRANAAVAALNVGWAIRNYLLISACSGGECPEKQIALYLLLICSAAMMIASWFPDIKIPQKI